MLQIENLNGLIRPQAEFALLRGHACEDMISFLQGGLRFQGIVCVNIIRVGRLRDLGEEADEDGSRPRA